MHKRGQKRRQKLTNARQSTVLFTATEVLFSWALDFRFSHLKNKSTIIKSCMLQSNIKSWRTALVQALLSICVFIQVKSNYRLWSQIEPIMEKNMLKVLITHPGCLFHMSREKSFIIFQFSSYSAPSSYLFWCIGNNMLRRWCALQGIFCRWDMHHKHHNHQISYISIRHWVLCVHTNTALLSPEAEKDHKEWNYKRYRKSPAYSFDRKMAWCTATILKYKRMRYWEFQCEWRFWLGHQLYRQIAEVWCDRLASLPT